MTHICVSDLTSNDSDNGLSPGRRQAIIRTNAGILLIRPIGTNFSEFLVEILTISFKKMRLKMLSAKRRSFCLGLNELNGQCYFTFKRNTTILINFVEKQIQAKFTATHDFAYYQRLYKQHRIIITSIMLYKDDQIESFGRSICVHKLLLYFPIFSRAVLEHVHE